MKKPPALKLLDAALGMPVSLEPPEQVNPLVVMGDPAISVVEQTLPPMSPREEFLTRQMVCLLVANGESVKSVAGKLQLTEKTVEKVIASDKGMDMIVRFQHDISPDPTVRIKKMASIALDVQTKLLLGPSVADGVKAKVANEVIDRAQGKAIQVTENRNMNFDITDSLAVDRALKASMEKLARIEEMQKKLSVPIGRADGTDSVLRPRALDNLQKVS